MIATSQVSRERAGEKSGLTAMFMVELLRVTPRAGPPNYSGILIFLPTPGGINERIKPNLRDVSAEKCGGDVYRESSVNEIYESGQAPPCAHVSRGQVTADFSVPPPAVYSRLTLNAA